MIRFFWVIFMFDADSTPLHELSHVISIKHFHCKGLAKCFAYQATKRILSILNSPKFLDVHLNSHTIHHPAFDLS